MTGGGFHSPGPTARHPPGCLRTLVPGRSNADVIATAIVAAARVYGDDPVTAVTAGSGQAAGRCIVPAIMALSTRHGDQRVFARLLGRSYKAVGVGAARRRRGYAPRDRHERTFAAAEGAAKAAIEALKRAPFKAFVDECTVRLPPEPDPAPENDNSKAVGAMEQAVAGQFARLTKIKVEPFVEAVKPLPAPPAKPAEPKPDMTEADAARRAKLREAMNRRRLEAEAAQSKPQPFVSSAGRLTSDLGHRPTAFTPAPAPPAAPGLLASRLVECLQRGASTAAGLAGWLGEKELLVEQTLKTLRHSGRVATDPPDAHVVRATLWRLPVPEPVSEAAE